MDRFNEWDDEDYEQVKKDNPHWKDLSGDDLKKTVDHARFRQDRRFDTDKAKGKDPGSNKKKK